jgi:sensor c-di-GMP phosphodiesterase-like protein
MPMPSLVSRSQYELNNLSFVNILLYAFLMLLTLAFLVHIVMIWSSSDVLHSYTENNLTKAEQITFQIEQSMALIQEEKSEPCTQADLTRLREIKQIYYFLGDLGRISNNKIICTVENGLLASPISLPAIHTTTRNGIQYRNSQTDLIDNNNNKPIITYQNVVLFLSPTYLKITKLGYFGIDGLAGIIYIDDQKRYIHSYFGNIVPSELNGIIAHKNTIFDWLPLPHKIRTETRCNKTYQLCMTAIDQDLGLFSVSTQDLSIVFAILLFLSLYSGVMIEYFRVGPRSFVRALKKQIHHNNIFPVYQPKLQLSTQKVIGVESLARWTDPKLGPISPDVFISVAEDTNLIEELTKKLMVKIFRDLHEILEADAAFSVSINISSELLTSDNFINFLNQLTSNYTFNRDQVILEITERSASNQDKMALFSKKLQVQGYLVSIDDFGTGVSNLSWLSALEPNEIKVDKSFTHAIETETVNRISLDGIFSMLEHLKVKVVFEGIETEQQRDFILNKIPTSIGQGWLFAKPKSIEELRAFINM